MKSPFGRMTRDKAAALPSVHLGGGLSIRVPRSVDAAVLGTASAEPTGCPAGGDGDADRPRSAAG